MRKGFEKGRCLNIEYSYIQTSISSKYYFALWFGILPSKLWIRTCLILEYPLTLHHYCCIQYCHTYLEHGIATELCVAYVQHIWSSYSYIIFLLYQLNVMVCVYLITFNIFYSTLLCLLQCTLHSQILEFYMLFGHAF